MPLVRDWLLYEKLFKQCEQSIAEQQAILDANDIQGVSLLAVRHSLAKQHSAQLRIIQTILTTPSNSIDETEGLKAVEAALRASLHNFNTMLLTTMPADKEKKPKVSCFGGGLGGRRRDSNPHRLSDPSLLGVSVLGRLRSRLALGSALSVETLETPPLPLSLLAGWFCSG